MLILDGSVWLFQHSPLLLQFCLMVLTHGLQQAAFYNPLKVDVAVAFKFARMS